MRVPLARMAGDDPFIAGLEPPVREVMSELHRIFKNGLPRGFTEEVRLGAIHFDVPLSIYPPGYHCGRGRPLPFVRLAPTSQGVSATHLGLYADPALRDWYLGEFALLGRPRPDIGKGCLRFRRSQDLPVPLLERLAGRLTPLQWIEIYERIQKGRRDGRNRA